MAGRIKYIIVGFLLAAVCCYAQEVIDGEWEDAKPILNDELRRMRSPIKTTDIEFIDSSQGIILLDRSTGVRYRLYMTGGVLTTEVVT